MRTYAETVDTPRGPRVRVVCAGGWVDWPFMCADGTVAYEHPGRVPEFIKPTVARLLRENERIDFTLNPQGTIALLCPQTDAARKWVEEHIGQDNGFQPWWPTVVIEHRYVQAILDGIEGDGLIVS